MVSTLSTMVSAAEPMSAISEKPNQSSLRIFITWLPFFTTIESSASMSASFTFTISLSLSTSTSSTSCARWGHSPVCRHMTQRMISTMPCSSRKAPGDRHHELERVDRQRIGVEGLLADGQRFVGEEPAGVGQGHDAGQEKQDVEGQVHNRPGCAGWKKPYSTSPRTWPLLARV